VYREVTIMHLWILRHGEAERETRRDSERALTELGRGDAEAAGKFLAGIDTTRASAPRFLASPYRRAQQTAQCALKSFPGVQLETVDWLVPDADPMAALQALGALQGEVVLVSHQPLVSAFGGLLVAGDFRAGPAMGTASLAEFDLSVVARGCATLVSLRHAPDYRAVAD
jgi:phosphohistidine phosphatase